MRSKLLCSAMWMFVAVSSGALAQQAAPGTGSPPPNSNTGSPSTSPAPSTAGPLTEPKTDTAAADVKQPTSTGQLGEIIVTAQRRSENVQRAAVPIAVISAQDILKGGVTDPTSLGTLVPALTATPAGGSRVNFFIRGVGNFTANPIFESAIAFNYDGVYVGRPGSTSGVFYDLERVEVLKGPQGTLYGRNATGGAINVLPVRPKPGKFSGYVSGGYGDYNAGSVEGAVNVPIGQDGAVRVSGNYVKHSGYLTDGTSDEDTGAFRIQMLGQMTPDLSIRVSFDYAHVSGLGVGTNYFSRYHFDPGSGQYIVAPTGLSPAAGFYNPAAQAFRASLHAGPAGRNLEALSTRQYSNNTFYGANAEISYNTGVGTLTVIPAWRYGDTNNITNTVGFPAQVSVKDDQVSLEARFAGKRIGPIDYTIGGFYYYETHKGGDNVNEQALVNYEENINLRTRSLAAFARVTGHVTDALRLVGAVRYTDDRKTFSGDAEGLTIVCVAPACPNAPLFPTVLRPEQLPFRIPPPGGVLPLFGTGALLVRSPSIIANNAVDPKSRVTYRGAIEYDLGPQSLLYASVESGFRSGGFNLASGYETFKPEYITAYTAGSKNRFFNNRVQLNLEGYLWKYKNQQLAHIGIDARGRQSFFVQNLGDLTIYGVDVDSRVLITPTTIVNAQLQYLHTKYDNFAYNVPTSFAPPFTTCATSVNVTNPAVTAINCAGKPGYNSPTWTLNLGGEQTINFANFKLVAEVDTQHRSSRYVGFDFVDSERAGSNWQTGAQLTFAPTSDVWSITGFVRNIENNRYIVSAADFAIGQATVGVVAPPRTYGVRGSVKF